MENIVMTPGGVLTFVLAIFFMLVARVALHNTEKDTDMTYLAAISLPFALGLILAFPLVLFRPGGLWAFVAAAALTIEAIRSAGASDDPMAGYVVVTALSAAFGTVCGAFILIGLN